MSANRLGVREAAARDRLGLLSAREREVLAYLADGFPNKAIAAAMALSDETIRGYVKSILRKTGLENRTKAALWAVRLETDGTATPIPTRDR